MPQATHQLERPVGLGLHPLARVVQPFGHAVERHRHLPQLVGAPHGHRRPGLPRRDPLDRLRQVGDRAEHEPLERQPYDEREQGGQNGPAQQALRVLAEKIGLQAPRDVGDLEHSVAGAGRPDGEEDGVYPNAGAPVRHDGRLARVPDLPVAVQGHSWVPGDEVRIQARPQVRVEQADANDLGLLDDQVSGEPLDVGERAGSKTMLHSEPDRRTRDPDPLIELRPSLLALLLPSDVGIPRNDQDHRNQENQHEAEP